MKAGFSEVDITPPAGTKKGGWLKDLEARTFLDPLFAKVAIFQDDQEGRVAFLQLDTLSVRWSDVDDLRKRITVACGFPGDKIMVSASHNHAGPAIARLAPVAKQKAYVETLKCNCVTAFTQALACVEDVEMGFSSVFEFEVAFNRRTVMRDGKVASQTYFSSNPDALYMEGPADPEVAVVIVKNKAGKKLGALVNFACHPVHHGGTDEITAGYPGVLAAKMREWGCPVTLFLNGAYGNVITCDFQRGSDLSKEQAGERLFEDVKKAFGQMSFCSGGEVGAESCTLKLPFRTITEDEYHGRVRGAQRYSGDELYEKDIDLIKAKIARYGAQAAEVQVIRIGDWYFTGIPGEYFVEHQLRIKMDTFPRRSYVVGGANGMVGYIPTKAAFTRGGYETTLGPPSWLAPEAGDRLAEAAIKMIKKMTSKNKKGNIKMKNVKIGIQLYTVREPLSQDFEGTLKKLSEMGIKGVELAFFYGGLEPDALAKLMKKLGLDVCGIYEGFDALCQPDSKVYAYAKAVGCKYLTSGLGLEDFKADYAGCVAKFKKACEVAASKGMTVCYHAHSHEFEKINGEYIMDKILADVPAMAFEADTAWIKCGGADPAGYIKKHLARIPLVHFKDVKQDHKITELGNGVVDFPAVLQVISGSKVEWVSYEQDNTDLTPLESTKISMDYLRKIRGVKS